jgi:GH15 family glucan-1,4-alpha-glucosidase
MLEEHAMSLSDLALIGNCQVSALVSRSGRIVWSCMPRFDSAPVFASLLDDLDGGGFTIAPADGTDGTQRYIPNTNVVETTFSTSDGKFRILDFAPRFIQFDRSFRPTKLIRIVEPISGTPRIRVRCDPVLGWSRKRPGREVGSHHIQYHGYEEQLRLTTNAPLSYLDGDAFALSARTDFVLSWGSPVEEPLETLCDRFRSSTARSRRSIRSR